MVAWELVYTKHTQIDAEKISSSELKSGALEVLRILESDPFQNPPPFEKSAGDLSGAFSRRINIQHRIVYQVIQDKKVVKIIKIWTHYE